MATQAQAAGGAGFEIDRAAHMLRFVRQLAAPREAVFGAWTSPEQLTCWWDAAGEPLTECEVDLRPGGHFRFVSPGHSHMAFTGTYLVIDPPERLEFEALDALGRVVLEEAGGGTRMTVEIVCNSAEHLDHYVKLGVARGTSATCDNLAHFIARRNA